MIEWTNDRLSSSRFELEVLAPLDRTVISNTPVMMSNEETVTLPSGAMERRKRWKFAETPIMSTYLVALVCFWRTPRGDFFYYIRPGGGGALWLK